MLAGSIFYKAVDGEIKELTTAFLRKKVREKHHNILAEDLEDLIRVLAYYIQSRKEQGLIREEDMETLLERLLPEIKGERLFVGGQDADIIWLEAFVSRRFPGLPEPVSKSLAHRLDKALEHLFLAGLREILPETLEQLCREQLRAMGLGFSSSERLSFPLDEILAIYSRYSPFQTGDYFNEIVNVYLYNHVFMDEGLHSLEKEGLLRRREPSFFRVDRLDHFEFGVSGGRELRELALLNIFYTRAHYDAFPGENKVLYRTDNSHQDVRRILSGEAFIPWQEGVRGFTFVSHENYSLFSRDESGFPVYPSCYNAELSVSCLDDKSYSDKLEILDRVADAVNRFYRKYTEYFYLVRLLQGRRVYMALYIDRDDPAYDPLLFEYLHRALDNDMVRIVLFNGSRTLENFKGTEAASKGFSVELSFDPELWNEKVWRYCKKNRVYFVQFET